MANYVLAYRGGGMPESEEESARVMAAWESWFDSLGASVVDGGNPFGAAQTIGPDGAVSDGGTLSGYSVIAADSLDAAVAMAKGCPLLEGGGSVEVHEAIQM